jgi:hypothetical protein
MGQYEQVMALKEMQVISGKDITTEAVQAGCIQPGSGGPINYSKLF